MNETDVVVVRGYYKADPLPPEESIRVLKRKAFDPTGYSFLRTNPVNGCDEYCPIDCLDHFRKEFNLPDDDGLVVYRLRTPPREENTEEKP